MHGSSTRLAAVVALLASALVAVSAGAERQVEVYRPRHRLAEELLPIARGAMPGGGTVALDHGTNALVLVGDAADVAEVLAVLARLDRRPRTIVLRYDTQRVADLAARGFDVRWNAVAGDFRVGNVHAAESAGSSVTVRVSDAVARLAETFTGTVRVTEGERARIETGTSVPYAVGGPDGGTHVEFATAANGFDASARVLDDGRVQVDLAAFAGRLGRQGRIETMNASVPVLLTPGETVAVGGLGRTSDDARREALRGARSASARDDTVLLLRADLE